MAREVDSFIIPSGKRKISLQKRTTLGGKPWVIAVHVKTHGSNGIHWTLLSTSEYHDEALALQDYNKRKESAGLKVRDEPAPMQRGRRLVQETLDEKLGARPKQKWEL